MVLVQCLYSDNINMAITGSEQLANAGTLITEQSGMSKDIFTR